MLGRLIQRWRFFVSDAWDEMRHSPGVNLLAATTLMVSLFVAGLTALVIYNVGQHVEELQQEIRLDVYLQDGVDDIRRTKLQNAIAATPGVERVVHVDKQEALSRYREWSQEMALLIGELDENPLPASLEVYLQAGQGAEEVGAAIAARYGQHAIVDDLRFDRDWIARLESMLSVARLGGLVMVGAVLAAVIFVISSVMRLAVYARRDEIEIMQLVGATPAFVRGPFLVAGSWSGLAGGVGALLLVEGVRQVGLNYASSASLPLLRLFCEQPVPSTWMLGLVFTGLVVGVCGSGFAARHRF